MVRCAILLPILNLLMAVTLPAAAETVVSFIHPEEFTDASLNGGCGLKAEQPALAGIARYLESLGNRFLRPHQVLVIDVTNVDLAGRFEPWRPLAYDVRMMRDIYPPRITLRYKLTDEGRVAVAGEERIADINYLANPGARFVQDPLRYEKAMLFDWFRMKLLPLAPPP